MWITSRCRFPFYVFAFCLLTFDFALAQGPIPPDAETSQPPGEKAGPVPPPKQPENGELLPHPEGGRKAKGKGFRMTIDGPGDRLQQPHLNLPEEKAGGQHLSKSFRMTNLTLNLSQTPEDSVPETQPQISPQQRSTQTKPERNWGVPSLPRFLLTLTVFILNAATLFLVTTQRETTGIQKRRFQVLLFASLILLLAVMAQGA